MEGRGPLNHRRSMLRVEKGGRIEFCRPMLGSKFFQRTFILKNLCTLVFPSHSEKFKEICSFILCSLGIQNLGIFQQHWGNM